MEEIGESDTPSTMRSTGNPYFRIAAVIVAFVLVLAWIRWPQDDDERGVDDGGPFEYLQTDLVGSIEMEAVRNMAVAYSLDVGDLDGDGIKEIVTGGVMANETTTAVEGDLRVWSYDPETNENASLASVIWPYFSGPTFSCVSIADVDRDGTNEIVAVAHLKPSFINSVISIWNYSSGSLNKEAETDALWGTVLTALAISDVDDDDQIEIVAVGYRESTTYRKGYVSIWSYLSNGASIMRETYRIWTDDDMTRLYSVVMGDIDRDGSIEIVTTGSGWDDINRTGTSEVTIFNLVNSSLFAKQHISWIGAGAKSSQLTDLDGDGLPELVVADTRQVVYTMTEYVTVWKFSNERQEMVFLGNGSYDSSLWHIYLEHFSSTCDSELCNSTIFTIGFTGPASVAWGLLRIWEFNVSDGTAQVAQQNSWGWGYGDYTVVYDAVLADIDLDGNPEIITAGSARGSNAYQIRIWDV